MILKKYFPSTFFLHYISQNEVHNEKKNMNLVQKYDIL